MCDHHLFIIIVPNDWSVNYDDNESARFRVQSFDVFLFSFENNFIL